MHAQQIHRNGCHKVNIPDDPGMLIGPETAELLIGDAEAPRPVPVMLSGLLPL